MNKIRIRFCPKCSSNELEMVAGGSIGIWKCKKCGFQSAIFPETTKIINFRVQKIRKRRGFSKKEIKLKNKK